MYSVHIYVCVLANTCRDLIHAQVASVEDLALARVDNMLMVGRALLSNAE